MAEEFQAAICGENWWNINPTRSILFPLLSSSSTCSIAANDAGNYNTWQSDFMDLKATTRSGVEETNNFVSEGFLDIEKQQQSESSASGTDSILIDSSTLQMMGFGMSSSTSSDWNQSLFGRAESNFHSVLQEGTDSSQIQTKEFSIDQQSLMNNSISSTGFPIGSSVNDNSYGYPSTVMQSLFDPTEPQQQQQQPHNSLFTNPSSMSSYSSSSILKPSMPKQSGLHFSNNTAFWNASAEALNDIRSSVFASSQTQYHQTPNFHEKNNSTHNNTLLNKLKREESPDAATAVAKKSSSSEPVFKRPRIETPSPLPTFKVRKEKLGDRITALQQLVSPFGKTDTASVLHEAIEYIKFLHDQVNVLSTPYLKNGATVQHQQGFDEMKETEEEGKQDLRSRGLCLVPISSTFPVANETIVDFWTPTFGGPLIGR